MIENSADALSYRPVRDMPLNMRVTAKQKRYNGMNGMDLCLRALDTNLLCVKKRARKWGYICVELSAIREVKT